LLFRGSLTEPVVLSRISIVERYQNEGKNFVNIEVEDDEHNVEQLRLALNNNGNDNDSEKNIFIENEGTDVTADPNDQTIENLFSLSFLDQVKSADGAHSSSIDSGHIDISSSRGGLSGFSSNMSGLINDNDDTNHDCEKGTKKEGKRHVYDSSLLSYQSTSCLSLSMDNTSFSPSSTHQPNVEEESICQDN